MLLTNNILNKKEGIPLVVDFHTHIFPNHIAAKTIQHLEQVGKIKAATDGSLSGLLQSMSEAGIDLSVVLPVVTKPSQFVSVNDYAAKINGMDGIISFGGIHPDTSDYIRELDVIKKLGLPGIKLHPDYQNTFIDDEKYVKIIRYALKLGLIITIHAGIDIGLPETVHCTPERVKLLLRQVEGQNLGSPKIILAHAGGYGCWDQVEDLLVGENVLFDISYSFGHINIQQLKRIIGNHGSHRILFATDCPWGSQKETLDMFYQLQLDTRDEQQILSLNATKLLGL